MDIYSKMILGAFIISCVVTLNPGKANSNPIHSANIHLTTNHARQEAPSEDNAPCPNESINEILKNDISSIAAAFEGLDISTQIDIINCSNNSGQHDTAIMLVEILLKNHKNLINPLLTKLESTNDEKSIATILLIIYASAFDDIMCQINKEYYPSTHCEDPILDQDTIKALLAKANTMKDPALKKRCLNFLEPLLLQ